jgi:predicted HAD superfamily Cof-like phosphohydrolase
LATVFMTAKQSNVRLFHEKAGLTINTTPTIPDLRTCDLRCRLIKEELEELASALLLDDIIEVADAIGDLLYVVLGTAVACGIDADAVFCEIHRSNMTKFIDGHSREDGKWIKGPAYEPPQLKHILEQQHPI